MKKYLFFLILIIFFACNSINKKEIIPGDILPKERMIQVMVDIELIEATLVVKKIRVEKEKGKVIDYYNSALQSHNISKEEFDRSFEYYTMHPEIFEQIYEEVIIELSKRQAEEDGEKKR
ncbi:MAG: DUF4296 domain-containing protein [Bacteroidota bacterium]